jgi:hypothetical protein
MTLTTERRGAFDRAPAVIDRELQEAATRFAQEHPEVAEALAVLGIRVEDYVADSPSPVTAPEIRLTTTSG